MRVTRRDVVFRVTFVLATIACFCFASMPLAFAQEPQTPEVAIESESGEATVEAGDADLSDDAPRYGMKFDSYLDDPDEAARKGLAEGVAPNWYSSETDEAIPIPVDPDAPEPYRDGVDPGLRDSGWLAKPRAPGRLPNFSGFPITGLVWTLLILLLVAITAILGWALWVGLNRKSGEAGTAPDIEEEEDPAALQDRIERLPFEVRQGVVDFLEEARRLAAAGKYEEALVYLFSHALVQLDRSHRIRLAKGKTNRQYVAEVSASPPMAKLLGEMVVDFERVFFGKYRLSQTKYEENVVRIDRFRDLLQQASHG